MDVVLVVVDVVVVVGRSMFGFSRWGFVSFLSWFRISGWDVGFDARFASESSERDPDRD